MKIKFSSGDDLPFNKQLKFINLTISVRNIFEECYSMKELMSLKELILISQINQRVYDLSLLVIKGIGYKYKPYVCNGCHDSSMMVYDLKDFMILSIKGINYRCYVFNTSKSDAINLLNNSVLNNKEVL